MKKTFLSSLPALTLLALMVAPVGAQDRIYRCGNEYTNNANQAKERGCKPVEGGNVTVVEGVRNVPASGAAGAKQSVSPPSAPRVSPNDQRARDADARAILESELRKAEARHAELTKEYNNGAPERNALDLRNTQRYAERTAEIKANLARSESDIAGIKRELARLPSP